MLPEAELFTPKEVSLDRQRAIHMYLVLEDILTGLREIDFKKDRKADIAAVVNEAIAFASCVVKAEKDILEDE